MVERFEGREPNQLRPVRITRHYLKHAMGSCIFELGDTRVLCAANIDEGVRATLALVGYLARNANIEIEFQPGMRGLYSCFPSKLNQVVTNLVVNAIQASKPGDRVMVRRDLLAE